MNYQAKQHSVKLILEAASVIGALYGFWKSHEKEIKDIVKPLMNHCIKVNEILTEEDGGKV